MPPKSMAQVRAADQASHPRELPSVDAVVFEVRESVRVGPARAL
jgi:hypothetical protein